MSTREQSGKIWLRGRNTDLGFGADTLKGALRARPRASVRERTRLFGSYRCISGRARAPAVTRRYGAYPGSR